MRFLFYIFILCFCCNGYCAKKTLNIENLFKRNKNTYSVKEQDGTGKAREKALQAKKRALVAQKQFVEKQITIIEVNLNWNYITFYYIGLLGVCVYYVTKFKVSPKNVN
tara:strand:+ start:11785 stop:12111 length:327 start_codon:yes stop_codon:yes gene_type:complete